MNIKYNNWKIFFLYTTNEKNSYKTYFVPQSVTDVNKLIN